jgi:putative aminopeptidase FrvX
MKDRSRAEQMISFTQELVRIESLSGRENKAAQRIHECVHSLGYDEVRVDTCGNVIGRVSGHREWNQ